MTQVVRGETGSSPFRIRSCAATIEATCAVRRSDLRTIASREMSSVSESETASAETAVRKTSMGCAPLTLRMTSTTSGASMRLAFKRLSKAASSRAVGSLP